MEKNKVSVIIPTYNDADVLSRAIESVLNQTYKNLELIVVNDASEDNTEEVVESYKKNDSRVKYFEHEENKGGSGARNTGIKNSSGEFIAFLDSDDEWLPKKLERQISLLKQQGDEWGGIYCDAKVINHDSENIFSFSKGSTSNKFPRDGGKELMKSVFLRKIHSCGSTLVIKKEIAKKINGFDESFHRHQELEFLIRILRNKKIAYLDEKLARIHKTKHSFSPHFVKDVKLKFLNKFKKEINYFEKRGYPILAFHFARISKHYFRNKRFHIGSLFLLQSIENLKNSKLINMKIVLIEYISILKQTFSSFI